MSQVGLYKMDMPLIFVRHAKALSRKKALLQEVEDSERALTSKGRTAFLAHIQKNSDIFAETELFISSPYIRAKQTLEILIHTLRAETVPCKILPQITPDDNVDSLIKWLEERDEKKIVIVGHEPFISNYLIQATLGQWEPQKIRKGDCVILTQKGRGLKVEIIGFEKD